MEKNPFLEQEDYFKGYNENIDKLKNNPELLAFDTLCYELFENQESGREFMKLIIDRYLLPSLVSKGNPTYQIDVLWQEGFKDAWRMIRHSVLSHKQRIKSEIK